MFRYLFLRFSNTEKQSSLSQLNLQCLNASSIQLEQWKKSDQSCNTRLVPAMVQNQ